MTDTAPQFVEIFTANADQPEVARKLLEAAGDAPEQVATVFGGFRVPAAIAEAAGFGPGDEDAADAAAVEGRDLAGTTPPVDGEGTEEEPKGAALDAALREAGLSTEGKADEKRARLAAHRAGTAG